MSVQNIQKIRDFCDAHGIYMEHRYHSDGDMYALYFEKNRMAFTKLVGGTTFYSETFADSMISDLRKKYKIPIETKG